ncbi:hypothetical protein LFM09_04790 [Lentzea alba]|uniref:hypothetical protein n=1 Tax=Lentzea alba TaxID=2714351 RepID=UPI0039BFBD20
MKRWLPLLLVLTACSPNVHVAEGPKTFATVDVCTLLKDSDVENQRLVKATQGQERSCHFEYGADEGKVSVQVTLLAKTQHEAKIQFCPETGDCAGMETTQYRSVSYQCDDTVRCEGLASVGEKETIGFVVRRTPDSRQALGEVTGAVARTLLERVPVTD